MAQAYLFRQRRILFEKLHDTVGQLWMIHAQTFDFVQWNQDSCQKKLVLFFQRQGKAVDDRSQNLEKLCDAVESLCFVNELEEHVVDRASDIRA